MVVDHLGSEDAVKLLSQVIGGAAQDAGDLGQPVEIPACSPYPHTGHRLRATPDRGAQNRPQCFPRRLAVVVKAGHHLVTSFSANQCVAKVVDMRMGTSDCCRERPCCLLSSGPGPASLSAPVLI